jgi:hypothetical protein
MARLRKSPADAFRMGQAARERVQSGFSYAQVVQGTLQALRQVGAPGAATRPAGFVG